MTTFQKTPVDEEHRWKTPIQQKQGFEEGIAPRVFISETRVQDSGSAAQCDLSLSVVIYMTSSAINCTESCLFWRKSRMICFRSSASWASLRRIRSPRHVQRSFSVRCIRHVSLSCGLAICVAEKHDKQPASSSRMFAFDRRFSEQNRRLLSEERRPVEHFELLRRALFESEDVPLYMTSHSVLVDFRRRRRSSTTHFYLEYLGISVGTRGLTLVVLLAARHESKGARNEAHAVGLRSRLFQRQRSACFACRESFYAVAYPKNGRCSA